MATAPVFNHVAHFAIHADDLDRARAFYTAVFGWKFVAWGPPDFFMITDSLGASPGPLGSLTRRLAYVRPEDAASEAFTTFECTIAVDDIDRIAEAVPAAGGRLTMRKVTIPAVGTLVKFRDTEQNLVVAMQYAAASGG
jgi:predicted enzyme related to lactoylglutathione lyase